MYVVTGGNVTDADKKFMTEMGIEPCTLGDPFPSPLLEQEAESGFVPPKTLWEYLARYPSGIRKATESAAAELGLVPPFGGLDAWARGLTEMSLGFAQADLEDIVGLFPYRQHLCRGETESERFHYYINLRVKAALPILLRDEAL